MRRAKSLDAAYFEAMYRDDPDPWRFASSPYERAKYEATLAALGDEPVARALEVGCAIGVLTQRLAAHCGQLVAVDISETALAAARVRCAGLAHVELLRMALPAEMPEGVFDLILLSEVAYYWDDEDLERMGRALGRMVAPGGRVLLVHWTGETDYPKSADEAVDALALETGRRFEMEKADRTEAYRLDLWRRLGDQP